MTGPQIKFTQTRLRSQIMDLEGVVFRIDSLRQYTGKQTQGLDLYDALYDAHLMAGVALSQLRGALATAEKLVPQAEGLVPPTEAEPEEEDDPVTDPCGDCPSQNCPDRGNPSSDVCDDDEDDWDEDDRDDDDTDTEIADEEPVSSLAVRAARIVRPLNTLCERIKHHIDRCTDEGGERPCEIRLSQENFSLLHESIAIAKESRGEPVGANVYFDGIPVKVFNPDNVIFSS